MDQAKQIELLEAAGYKVKIWKDRLYVKKDGVEFGYLVPGDDGYTGTCRGIHKRQGTIAAILRGEKSTLFA